MIAVVDYGVGNLYSLTCSLRHIGAQCTVTREENALRAADRTLTDEEAENAVKKVLANLAEISVELRS